MKKILNYYRKNLAEALGVEENNLTDEQINQYETSNKKVKASTQFYLTELNNAMGETRTANKENLELYLQNIGEVFHRAHTQSWLAVQVGLEKSKKDGTKPMQQIKLIELWNQGYNTWYNKAPGLETIVKKKGVPK